MGQQRGGLAIGQIGDAAHHTGNHADDDAIATEHKGSQISGHTTPPALKEGHSGSGRLAADLLG
jgi:hypothetical protein